VIDLQAECGRIKRRTQTPMSDELEGSRIGKGIVAERLGMLVDDSGSGSGSGSSTGTSGGGSVSDPLLRETSDSKRMGLVEISLDDDESSSKDGQSHGTVEQ